MLKQLKKFFRTTLIGGLVVILPITIFVVLAKLIFDFIRTFVEPITRIIDFGTITNRLLIDLIALAIIIGFCFFVGLFVQTRTGKILINYLDSQLLDRLPFYSTIKETVQQFTGAKKIPFSRVVMVNVFNTGTKMLGFISDEHADKKYTIFVPTGPNPTNGFIFIVDEDQLEFTDIKPEEAMRTIIAVGTGASKLFEGKQIKDTESELADSE
jgi:uncharacterized membrane protein